MIVEVTGSIGPALRKLKRLMEPEWRLLKDRSEPKRSKRKRTKAHRARNRRRRKAAQHKRFLQEQKLKRLGRL